MNPKIKLLDSAKKMCSPQTDMELAARIGVSRSAVSMWRKGGSITEEHLTALASIAETDGEVVARVLKDQAKTEAQKRVWGQLLDRLSAAAAVVALIAVGVHVGAHESVVAAFSPIAMTAPSIHYAKSRC
ncbi:helix-turn-helix transcriptional regulator [Xanthomonas euvesicatoria]|uniref:helix-turn-helix domain-containing protein n=1 Tax=Xanthomonas citri TaxID=346 RepID=UPI001878226E|nr:helix-turn-helix transcriptional regulator [Xanthomonas axonopodis]MEE5092053.1 helix-turn-helix transcriptional regulator [Xanthomonas euvesicatoria]